MKKIMFVLGTRPEAIKLAPVILEMQKIAEVCVVFTGQHNEMADDVFETFHITPHYRLAVSAEDLTLVLARVLQQVKMIMVTDKPDMVIVQGDTTSALGAAMVAFHQKIPVAHVEAGLRTFDMDNPFPEEANRVMIDNLSTLLFPPTFSAYKNLRAVYFPSEKGVYETGNTVVDAIHYVLKSTSMPTGVKYLKPYVLITAHRRESFGRPLQEIAFAVKQLASKFKDHHFIYPIHLNPQVRPTVEKILGDIPNVILAKPWPYREFVHLMYGAELILSDSGGIQEEVTALLTPLLILRDKTERPEIISNGGMLVGRRAVDIFRTASELLMDEGKRKGMISTSNPFGDGGASERIIKQVIDFFGDSKEVEKK